MKILTPKGPAVALGMCLITISSAQAQDQIATSSPALEIDLVVQSHDAMADWLEAMVWQSALDGPGSGGPGDVQAHIDTLRTSPPGSVASISNGFFWVIDPGLEAELQSIGSAGLPVHLHEHEVEVAVLNLLVLSGAPILHANISNGI